MSTNYINVGVMNPDTDSMQDTKGDELDMQGRSMSYVKIKEAGSATYFFALA